MSDSTTTTTTNSAQPCAFPSDLVSPTQLAQLLNCSRMQVYILAKKAWWPKSLRFGVRSQRWSWTAVIEAIEANRAHLDAEVAAKANKNPPPRKRPAAGGKREGFLA